MKGWNDFEIGAILFPFANNGEEALESHNNERDYTPESSFKASVAHWRVEKPVHNSEICINCFNCWVYCPDAAILARDEKLRGVDYVHCKGCGICVDVCPTNPKSLLMFSDHEDNQNALKNWPQKEEKKKN
ncbi:pyruvate ferredoxin oxidoreductase [Helicobacter sp. 12S02232-10]|uniref:4Fe-4S dicluster domain-containing protein n=1 Tax=Helicobacter sp. 12S02232-10 TaxID=1476197 RepID=UPI000BA7074C|nr:4Fe-4S dicluster-binding protein [Helicobacter sp. 12S02232-10]PAF47970.1 pyruvate ferredoxin oxidoreductase [Helicobacter sp. 12S02232-10]